MATVNKADITVIYIPFNFDDVSENLLIIPWMLFSDEIFASVDRLSILKILFAVDRENPTNNLLDVNTLSG